MRILVYSLNCAPELTGIGKYVGEMVESLVGLGHEVRVVTGPPFYPEWKRHEGHSAWRYTSEDFKGAKVIRAPMYVPTHPSGVKRLIHLFSFAVTSLPVMFGQIRWRPEVVWVVEPPLFAAPAALAIARMCGARAWLHIQDYEVEVGFSLGLMKGKYLRRLITGVERALMRRFDRVSAISHAMVARAATKGVPPERLTLFPNWVDTHSIRPLDRPSTFRASMGICERACVILYSGNMGAKQGLEVVADAAALLQGSEHIVLVFCGQGATRAELEARCVGMSNVRFLPLQPVEQLSELLGLADIHVLPQREDAADLVLPSKVTGMLASGRPIIATTHAETGLGKIVMQCGRLAAPGNAEALALAIKELAADLSLRKLLGAAGRRYAEAHLAIDQVMRTFDQELTTLVDAPETKYRKTSPVSGAGD